MNEELYIAFLKLCAEFHAQILHNDETNVRFSQFGEEIVTQISAGGVLKITEPCLIMYCQEFEDVIADSGPQTQKSTNFNFEICQYAPPTDFVAQSIAQSTAKTIATEKGENPLLITIGCVDWR